MVEQGVREVYVVGDRLHRSQSDVPDVEDEERKEGASCLCLPRSMVPTALTRTTVYDDYTNKSLAMNVVSTILILFDYGSDISVAFWLRKEKDSDFFLLCTIVLILLPLAVVNLFSLVWYSQVLPSPRTQDHLVHPSGFVPRRHVIRPWRRRLLLVAHMVGLGPVVRLGVGGLMMPPQGSCRSWCWAGGSSGTPGGLRAAIQGPPLTGAPPPPPSPGPTRSTWSCA